MFHSQKPLSEEQFAAGLSTACLHEAAGDRRSCPKALLLRRADSSVGHRFPAQHDLPNEPISDPQLELNETASGLFHGPVSAPKPDPHASTGRRPARATVSPTGAAHFPSPSRHWFFPSRCGILAQGH
jgi:hypothetical protein